MGATVALLFTLGACEDTPRKNRLPECYTKGHRECGEGCLAPDRLQWVRNGLTLTTADDYNSKVLSERGGAGQRVGYTKIGLRASPNRITQNHMMLTGTLGTLGTGK